MRKCFQNLLKLDNIEENLLNGKVVISNSYNNLRRLESSGVLSENPRVRSSILRLGTIKTIGRALLGCLSRNALSHTPPFKHEHDREAIPNSIEHIECQRKDDYIHGLADILRLDLVKIV